MLAIDTPAGRETVAHEARAISLYEAVTGRRVALTARSGPNADAAVDGIVIAADHSILSVFEVKCRRMTLHALRKEFGNQWLVTLDKVLAMRELCAALRVPAVGWLYLIDDDVLLLSQICAPHASGGAMWTAQGGFRKSATQATVNGGLAMRTNLYIDMGSAIVLRRPACSN